MMNQYTMTRTILARPMTRQEYNDLRDWKLPADENGADEGFLIEYLDGTDGAGYNGYITWLPAEEFKRTCKPKQAAPVPVKTLHNSDVSGARKNVKDIIVVGNGDMFQLLCKASSQAEGWMKSTKAMQTPNGCIVQVTTQQRNPDGSYAVAEALTFVPDVCIAEDVNNGRRLVQL